MKHCETRMDSYDDLDLGFFSQIKSSVSSLVKGVRKITSCITLSGVCCRIKEVVSSVQTYSQLGNGDILNVEFVESLCVCVCLCLGGGGGRLEN